MQQLHENLKLDYKKLDQLFDLHLAVLKQIVKQKPFDQIVKEFVAKIKHLNYLEIAKTFQLLSFNRKGKIRGAVPISPKKTEYRISIEGIGSGYAMCAMDTLAVPYLFNAKTIIDSVDPVTKQSIRIVLDPHTAVNFDAYSQLNITTLNPAVTKSTNGQALDPSVDICPYIGFTTSVEAIPEDQQPLVNNVSFEQALTTMKTTYSPTNFKNGIRVLLNTLLQVFQVGALSTTDFVNNYLDTSPNSQYLEKLPREQVNQFVVNQFTAKGMVKENSELQLELTSLGIRIVKTFLE